MNARAKTELRLSESKKQALIAAARETEWIMEQPAPFVLQTSLDDFYVNYELNAYTDQPQQMVGIYSRLHQNIQDQFNEAGIEIILNMREKMIEMERQMEEFAHVVQQELSRVASHREEPNRHAIVRATPRVIRVPVREG